MLFPLIIVSVFLFLVFSVIFGPLAFFLLCFGMFWFYCFFRNRVILRYDAATLHVIYRRDLVFAQWHKQRIYNRADVPPPVTWIHAISPNFRSFRLIDNSLSWEFHYETRFPFLLRKTRGVICMHPGKEKMLALQKAVDDFLAEVPYDKTLFDRTEASLSSQNVTRNTIVKPQEREQKRDATRFDSAKRYAFDRGETPIRRGDESVAKGEPAAKKKRTRNKSYALRRCSMVKIEEEVSADLTQGTLKLVSTSGGVFSAGMAVLSILLFYAGLLTLVIGGSVYLAMQIYRWEQIERCFERYLAPHLEQSVFPRLPEEMREPVVDAMQWYIGASRGGDKAFQEAIPADCGGQGGDQGACRNNHRGLAPVGVCRHAYRASPRLDGQRPGGKPRQLRNRPAGSYFPTARRAASVDGSPAAMIFSWAAAISYSARRISVVRALASYRAQLARGSPSRGCPTEPALTMVFVSGSMSIRASTE